MSDADDDLPRGWEWWSGERGPGYYARWFGTAFHMGGALVGVHGLGGYTGELYWDRNTNGEHHVAIYAIVALRDGDDPEFDEYPVASGTYDSEDAALAGVPTLIRGLYPAESDGEAHS